MSQRQLKHLRQALAGARRGTELLQLSAFARWRAARLAFQPCLQPGGGGGMLLRQALHAALRIQRLRLQYVEVQRPRGHVSKGRQVRR